MTGILSIDVCNACVIRVLKQQNFPKLLLLLSVFCTLINFTRISQMKICFLSVVDAEGQEEGVETTVDYE